MNNRKHNSSNPYQGSAKKVLCVCSAGLLRSPTIANVLHAEYGYNCRAVGWEKGWALIPVDDVLVGWADEIVCANSEAYDAVLGSYTANQFNKQVLNLDIPDEYEYMEPALIDLIKTRYSEINP